MFTGRKSIELCSFFIYANLRFTHTEKGFCVLLTLLPGDSPGFDFGKSERTNQLFVVTPAPPISCELGYRVGGPLRCFHSTLSIAVSFLRDGGRVGSVCYYACLSMYVFIHA
ncbi:hypothetical protein GOODEAATRI_015218 [Goodea atripinnis]|uniref:Uncharacterized protein n=1 Tax=Goodea atripinnis TaxID=208336 RepID=A0ABV0MHX6_9TELE